MPYYDTNDIADDYSTTTQYDTKSRDDEKTQHYVDNKNHHAD